MSKDQTIGALTLIVCAIIIVGYITALFLYPLCIQPCLNLGANADVQFWLIATPVLVAFVAILLIVAWIGYTMATTPPPKPIEELTAESTPQETSGNKSD
jgi:H+/Cl- antiporter ClcA